MTTNIKDHHNKFVDKTYKLLNSLNNERKEYKNKYYKANKGYELRTLEVKKTTNIIKDKNDEIKRLKNYIDNQDNEFKNNFSSFNSFFEDLGKDLTNHEKQKLDEEFEKEYEKLI